MVRIALLGEHNPESETHCATDQAILHASKRLGTSFSGEWLSSSEVTEPSLDHFDGLWVAPGAPHKNLGNTLAAIRYARERRMPAFGTCGGFQLMVLEVARNVLGIGEAEHAEYAPDGQDLFITPLSCSLRGRELVIKIVQNSQVGRLYKTPEAVERYYCRFGVNPAYHDRLLSAPIAVVGGDAEGDIRIIELPGHPFFVATLFVPQVQSSFEKPHPLVTGFLHACKLRQK